MAIEKTPVFEDLEAAKQFAKDENASGKYSRNREVYSLTFNKDGVETTRYLVAQTLIRAHSHSVRVLRDELGVKLSIAEKAPRAAKIPTSADEVVKVLSPEELDKMRKLLDSMAAPTQPEVESEKPKRGRKHGE